MPSCSKAKNPKGIEITFEEETHKYSSVIDGRLIEYISGTTFLSKFYPKFDPDGSIAERCAKKEGLTVESLQAKWKEKGANSCRLGTRMHETIEDVLHGNQLRNTAEDEVEQRRFDNAISIAKKIKSRVEILGIEKIVFDERLKIAGTIDLFAKAKDGSYLIIDHKSNKTIDTYNTFNKFCLYPIQHLPDLSFHHYSLQLSLYEYLLKYAGYVDKNAKFRRFINHVTEKKSELIELPDYQKEIRDMIIEHLLKT